MKLLVFIKSEWRFPEQLMTLSGDDAGVKFNTSPKYRRFEAFVIFPPEFNRPIERFDSESYVFGTHDDAVLLDFKKLIVDSYPDDSIKFAIIPDAAS